MIRNKVTIYIHAVEYSNNFRVNDSFLFCIYYNHTVKQEKKSIINDHIYSIIYYAKKREYENKQKANRNVLQQKIIVSTILITSSKKELIEDLIHTFAVADIPLEKVNSLLSFFQKHMKQGGFISQAPTLCQIYLLQ